MGPKLLIVSLNYRTPEMTLRSVQAALREMAGLNAELVIVDNDSGDASFETMQAALGSEDWAQGAPIRLIQSGHNGGFGAGNNQSFRLTFLAPKRRSSSAPGCRSGRPGC